MFSSHCCFVTCIQVSQEAGQVVWYSHLFKINHRMSLSSRMLEEETDLESWTKSHFWQQIWELGGDYHSHFTDDETVVHRCEVTCLRSHNNQWDRGLRLDLLGSRDHVLWTISSKIIWGTLLCLSKKWRSNVDFTSDAPRFKPNFLTFWSFI